jgi:hypothetical protein
MKRIKTFEEWIKPIQFINCSKCNSVINLITEKHYAVKLNQDDKIESKICICCNRDYTITNLFVE